MKNILLLLLLFFLSHINISAQSKSILTFDLRNGTVDSITNVVVDTTIQSSRIPHYVGDFNTSIEIFSEDYPMDNVFPNTEFSLKRKAALDFDINTYPIRTSVKLFNVQNDSLVSLCSGSMISKSHVLTATHCIAEINTNNLSVDSLLVCPVLDQVGRII